MPKSSRAVHGGRQSLRVREIARANDLAPTTIYNWVTSGLLPASKVGGVVLVAVKDWETFLAKNRVQAIA